MDVSTLANRVQGNLWSYMGEYMLRYTDLRQGLLDSGTPFLIRGAEIDMAAAASREIPMSMGADHLKHQGLLLIIKCQSNVKLTGYSLPVRLGTLFHGKQVRVHPGDYQWSCPNYHGTVAGQKAASYRERGSCWNFLICLIRDWKNSFVVDEAQQEFQLQANP
jgi:hypothetical protein